MSLRDLKGSGKVANFIGKMSMFASKAGVPGADLVGEKFQQYADKKMQKNMYDKNVQQEVKKSFSATDKRDDDPKLKDAPKNLYEKVKASPITYSVSAGAVILIVLVLIFAFKKRGL